MSAEDDRQDALDELAEDYVRRSRNGLCPKIDEYVARHPSYAADIRELFPMLIAMEGLRAETGVAPLPAGGQVGPYVIVREIGRGGMGIVYEAVQTELGRRVALKLLPTQATLDPRFLERFRLEAQAAAQLRHPNIVPVIGYGQHEDMHYYSMEYIDGRGLDAVMREAFQQLDDPPDAGRSTATSARMHFDRVARIGLQAAEGLAHAHAHGVLHRDIKPSNLLLDTHEHLWIADFGLCQQEGSAGLTASGDVLGTFRYLPPERFSGVSDARGDVYGVGITMYELLTRRRAYDGDDPAAIAARITQEEPRRPRAHDPRIPPDLETIVRMAMAHNPARRYATAEALAADLSAYLEGRPIAARTPTAGYLFRKAIGRHKTLAITVLVAALLLMGSTVWYVADLQAKQALARFRQYAANIAAVEAALRARDSHLATEVLKDAPHEYRNWEWRHLHSRVEQDLRRFESLPVRIFSVAYHPKGTHFAATLGAEVWIYEDHTGEVVRRLLPEHLPVCLRWAPSGKHLAVGTQESLEIWSWPDGERVFQGETGGEHRTIEYTADGGKIVAGIVQGSIRCYDADGGGERTRVPFHTRVLCLATDPTPGSERVLIGSADGRITMLRSGNGASLWSRSVSNRGLHNVAFLEPDRVGCAVDGLVRVLSAADGSEIRTQVVDSMSGAIIHDPTGERLLVFGQRRLHVFDARVGTALLTLSGGALPDRAAVHPDGRRVIVASGRGMLREWYLGEGGSPLVLARHISDVTCLDIDPTGRYAASGGFGGVVRLWDVETGELARVWFCGFHVLTGMCFDPQGRTLAVAGDDGRVLLRDVPSGRVLLEWQADKEFVGRLAYAPDGRSLFSVGADGYLRAWDPATGKQKIERATSEVPIMELTVSHNGRWVATGDREGLIRLFTTTDLQPIFELPGHVQWVTGLAFHPNDKWLASVSRDQMLKLWDPKTGQAVRSTARDPELSWGAGLNAVAFTPDGSRIATGSFSGSVRLWDPSELGLLGTLKERHWVSALRFSPDGTRLFTSLSDGTIRIRDSVPMRVRSTNYEHALGLRAQARPLVAAMALRIQDLDELLLALGERTDLDAEVLEAALRIVHHKRGTWDAMVERMWRGLLPHEGAADRRRNASALAEGFWRATRHAEHEDPRCDTLLGLAYLRSGLPEDALWVFERIAARNRQRAPALYAIDLAVASLAHRALAQPQEARTQLDELRRLLAQSPSLVDERVRSLFDEAAAAPQQSK